jgi:hypothetical protein
MAVRAPIPELLEFLSAYDDRIVALALTVRRFRRCVTCPTQRAAMCGAHVKITKESRNRGLFTGLMMSVKKDTNRIPGKPLGNGLRRA